MSCILDMTGLREMKMNEKMNELFEFTGTSIQALQADKTFKNVFKLPKTNISERFPACEKK